MPDNVPPAVLLSIKEVFSRALSDALSAGLELPLLRSAAEAAGAAFARTREIGRAALAAQHNAPDGPDGPRMLPLCLELQVAIVHMAYSDR